MSLNSDNNVPHARLCHVVKWDDFEGYGFNLHAEKGKDGQYIGKVDEGSPSEAAGLKQGDRIVEVNEINIANETHKQVVERIKAFPNETKLLVVDQTADDYFKANNITIVGSLPSVKVIKTPEKNPASSKEESPVNNRSFGSNSSNDETVEKSISSTDSGSTAATTVANNNSGIEQSRENGSRIGQNENIDNGTAGSGNGSVNSNMSGSEQNKSLNLKMSAKELRAQLAARKKFDPKKESMDFKSKFDIVQKL